MAVTGLRGERRLGRPGDFAAARHRLVFVGAAGGELDAGVYGRELGVELQAVLGPSQEDRRLGAVGRKEAPHGDRRDGDDEHDHNDCGDDGAPAATDSLGVSAEGDVALVDRI